jgi:hypothetical protein
MGAHELEHLIKEGLSTDTDQVTVGRPAFHLFLS